MKDIKQKKLSREDILNCDDIKTEDVDVEEWGGFVTVRVVTGAERDAFDASIVKGEGKKQKISTDNIRARFAALTVIDKETGKRIFSDTDIGALGKKSSAALTRVWNVAQKLNYMTEEDIEELKKNSEAEDSDDSFLS